jgi:predicted NACHT family NTPase
VRAEDSHRVLKEIRDFSAQFWNNHFVITCRIAAWDYTFEAFTEVEVADFNESQISTFYISDYIRNFSQTATELEFLQLDSWLTDKSLSEYLNPPCTESAG